MVLLLLLLLVLLQAGGGGGVVYLLEGEEVRLECEGGEEVTWTREGQVGAGAAGADVVGEAGGEGGQ